MTNREVTYIVKDQKPLVLTADQTVQHACQSMWEHRAGSVLIVDGQQCLCGIFTGRDAVRVLAKSNDAAATLLAKAKTSRLVTITPESRAIDALRAMSDGGFRHVPVTENGEIWGVVSRSDFKGMEIELFLRAHTSKSGNTKANRELAHVVKDQKPLVLASDQTVQQACQSMWEHRAGSVLVVDVEQRLSGIFTGRDAVRVLAKDNDAAATLLENGMTHEPVTIAPQSHAIDALRAMGDHGFRHLPVVENGRILGVVSRSDFTGIEIDRLDEEEHLWECIR